MTLSPADTKLLEDNGWTVECESPLEIRHVDGSFASQLAAQYALPAILEDLKNQDVPCI